MTVAELIEELKRLPSEADIAGARGPDRLFPFSRIIAIDRQGSYRVEIPPRDLAE